MPHSRQRVNEHVRQLQEETLQKGEPSYSSLSFFPSQETPLSLPSRSYLVGKVQHLTRTYVPGTKQDPEYQRGKKFTVHVERQRYLAHKYLHNNMCGTLYLELYKIETGHSEESL